MKIIDTMYHTTLTDTQLYRHVRMKQACLFHYTTSSNEQLSVVGFDPVYHLTFKDQLLTVNGESTPCLDPLHALEDYTYTDEAPSLDLPFQGGAIGYTSYDLAFVYEPLTHQAIDILQLPDMQFYLYETFIVLNETTKTVSIICSNMYSHIEEAILDSRLRLLKEELALLEQQTESFEHSLVPIKFSSSMSTTQFQAVVRKAKEYIQTGDLFQVVPSQRLSASFTQDVLAYYHELAKENPTTYRYLLSFPDVVVVGCSPETLVKVEQRTVTTNPIAGTRKRGKTDFEDQAFAQDLLQDEKERAEHQMLVDLGRNDLGKVSQIGSVRLPLFMQIKRYHHVMHLASIVQATLLESVRPIDALKATLPAGTVSGAPKIRAMKRIYEFEATTRGIYAGGIGFLSHDQQLDFAIAIRTMIIKDEIAHVQAGAGIVFDSEPELEYQETLNKAKTLLEVLI